MGTYAKSENIIAIPITKERGAKVNADGTKTPYYNGRVLSEKNISTLIASLTDRKCFVIKGTKGNDENYIAIEFIMAGHYFKLTDLSLLQPTQTQADSTQIRPTLTAQITIGSDDAFDELKYGDEVNGAPIATESTGDQATATETTADQTDVFTGIQFITGSAPKQQSDSTYTLVLLENGEIPASSFARFDTIDGGIV